MKINKALKIRIYPNKSQKIFINKTLGSCRFLYNQMLAERIEVYENLKDNKRILYEYNYKTEKQYKEEFDFLKEVDSQALQQSNRDLQKAYSNFYKSLKGLRKGRKIGFPKFKKKKHGESYRTHGAIHLDFDKNKLKLPLLPWINFKHKNIKSWFKTAKIKNVTISRTSTEKYFASILFEGEQDFNGYQRIENNIKVTGLDMSLDKFFIDNLGNSPDYKRIFRENEKKLAKAQRNYSRKTNGSKNKEKARLKVARIHERIKNQREDFINKLSLDLVKHNDVIVIESLSLQGMSQSLRLGKSIMDLGYSSFINKLQYKALWNDKILIKANKWFASSKTCSTCGYVNKNLLLQERKWECPNCGTILDRDQNAGQNLLNYGLNFLGLEQPKVTSVDKKTSRSNSKLCLAETEKDVLS